MPLRIDSKLDLEKHNVSAVIRVYGKDFNVDAFVANCTLPVLIEGIWKPKCAAVRQRTKAGIKVIKARIDQLHRDSKAI